MQVLVNGRAVEVPEGTTIAALLLQLGSDRGRVAVERNQDVIPRATWDICALAAGDQLEIVTFVGGG